MATSDDESSLRIGVIAPPWFDVPPSGYGGIEAVIAPLVNNLAARGHHVVLVGAGKHLTAASEFIHSYRVAPSEKLGTPLPEVLHAAVAAEGLGKENIDLVHDHTLAGPLLARGREVPTVVTMHGPVTGELGRYFEALGTTINLVAISDSQRRQNPNLNWVATVPNAIDVESFPFERNKDKYLLWLGRFCADKAPDRAIAAARSVGRKVILAGKLSEPAEKEYFRNVVEPLLGPDAEFVGEANSVRKRELLAGAAALLFPIQWEEPFGMVMVEAMACGTPVIALRRGAVPDIVVHGHTGFIADDQESFIDAIGRVGELDPSAIRAHVSENFGQEMMATRYERVYRSVIAASPRPRESPHRLPTPDTHG